MSTAAPPLPHRRRRPDATPCGWWTDVARPARLAADHLRPAHHRDRLPDAERPLPHRLELRQPDRPVGGLHDDRHGHRLRAAARRDRPVGRLRVGRGGRDRRHAADPRRQRGETVVAVGAALGAGTAIGTFHGILFTKIGIPSFVVTLAGLIAWNGVVLLLIGAAAPSMLQDDFLIDLANEFLSEGTAWILMARRASDLRGHAAERVGPPQGGTRAGPDLLSACASAGSPSRSASSCTWPTRIAGSRTWACSWPPSSSSGASSSGAPASAVTCMRSEATPRPLVAPGSTSTASASTCSRSAR